MKKYGKIILGTLHVPANYPGSIKLEDGTIINNPTEDDYKAAGYVEITETEPEEREGFVAEATYSYNTKKTKIVQAWEYVEAPEPRPMEEEEPAPKKTTRKTSSK